MRLTPCIKSNATILFKPMETLLVCLLLLYNVWIAVYLLWEKRQGHKPSLPEVPPIEKAPEPDTDIVGKSQFRMKPKEPITANQTPQAATSVETEKGMENDSTFAPEAEKRSSARIPDDKLDEAFEHLEIPEVPLEYEDDEPEDEEEEMPLVQKRQSYASGVSFEEIDAAVKTAGNPLADGVQRGQAGQIFGQIEGTEFFDKLKNCSADIGDKITGLMDYYFSQSISRDGEADAVAVQPLNISEMPDDISGFDIRSFV